MIVRIVKMTFREDAVESFLSMFEKYNEQIRASDGCSHVELLRGTESKNTFFTYSHWENESYLNRYRESELFAVVWKETKSYFAGKPEAWSTVKQ